MLEYIITILLLLVLYNSYLLYILKTIKKWRSKKDECSGHNSGNNK